MSRRGFPFWIRKGSLRLFLIVVSIGFFAMPTYAGGPRYVAGSSFFNSSMMGQPLTWSGGQLKYYTDQGDLSPILTNSAANALVANSFLQWTSVSSAAITATNAGQLAEDVNGSDIEVNANGVVTAPSDVTPSATSTPIGIVYDYDGSVTNALLGEGAGDPAQCFGNAVFGAVDNFGTGANYLHALVVINGQCALQSSQLTDIEYRLVRVLGNILGLGWSQLNLNVITGDPAPTADDYAGFPVMHDTDPVECVPITICYANPYQLAPDDIAALSRLYPGTTNPASARIHGSVYFASRSGGPAQPMQGVNVFARWIDPSTNLPSHQYSVSNVSGDLFTGNAGNAITGFADPLGMQYSEFGSDSSSVEGFYDLGGLPIPNGASSAQYQLSVEAINTLWSFGVLPYEDSEVAPSGVFNPITVTVEAGGDFEQDIQMTSSAQAISGWAATDSWNAPAIVPVSGDWVGSLGTYGAAPYFLLQAQANRTFSVAITALDETNAPSESKVEPVIGIWTQGDAQGTSPPAFTSSPFNSETFATSRLDAQVFLSSNFILGLSDLRGDGRPDYSYHAHVLYGDSVTPSRLPVGGGSVTLQGTGFAPGLSIAIGSANAPLLALSSGRMTLSVSGQTDGVQDITVTDPVTRSFSTMTGVLTFGAAASDKILLLQGGNPTTPIGTQATNPVSIKVVQSDGVTPVAGATIGWSSTNSAALSACSGAYSCSVTTDAGGLASTWITPSVAGVATITATVAPGVYGSSQAVSGTLFASSSSSEIGVTTPYLWIAQGSSLTVPITARLLNAGVPIAGAIVNFSIDQGSGTLSSLTATSNSSGYATVNLTLTNFTSSIELSACAAPADNPCQNVYGNAVSPALFNLWPVSGGFQVVSGQAFQPITVRVTDSSSPANPILGATVSFQSELLRLASNNTSGSTPEVLNENQTSIQSDVNGLASLVPSVGAFSAPLEMEVQISAGTSALLQDVLESLTPNPLPTALIAGSAAPQISPPYEIFSSEWVIEQPLGEPTEVDSNDSEQKDPLPTITDDGSLTTIKNDH